MKISEAIVKLKNLISQDAIYNGREVTNIERDFLAHGLNPNNYYDGEVVDCKWNKKTKSWNIKLFIGDVVNIDETLETYLNTIIKQYTKSIQQSLITLHLSLSSIEFGKYLDKLNIELNSLIDDCTKHDTENHLQFIKLLEELQTEITDKYKVDCHVQKEKNMQKKIKWLGNINTLATLFYDLSTGQNNLNKKLIDLKSKELVDFICNNFSDPHGNNLTESSIRTYLDPNKPEKKAKKERITFREDLDNATYKTAE